MVRLQNRDREQSFPQNIPGLGKLTKPEPSSDTGKNKGLTVILDSHTDVVSGSTVLDDFQGFVAIVDGKGQFPLSTRKSVMIRPGYNNLVALGATKISADEDIKDWGADKRLCYFQDDYILKSHAEYTQVSSYCSYSKVSL